MNPMEFQGTGSFSKPQRGEQESVERQQSRQHPAPAATPPVALALELPPLKAQRVEHARIAGKRPRRA
jgi:hypothetical protein